MNLFNIGKIIIIGYVIFISCDKIKPVVSSTNQISFTEVTKYAGLSDFRHITGAAGDKWFPESMGSGGGFIDYNGDSWPDILLVSGGVWPEKNKSVIPALYLYRNNRDGTFMDVTASSGLADLHTYGFGITVADYDNDDDQDFFFTTIWQNHLFRND